MCAPQKGGRDSRSAQRLQFMVGDTIAHRLRGYFGHANIAPYGRENPQGVCIMFLDSSLIARPHLLVPGHQRTMSTSNGCNQWVPLAKTLLKVALAGGNRSLVARTVNCRRAISDFLIHM